MMRNLDRFRGCLIGSAAGDALGYEVEFMDIDAILHRFGPDGITEYMLHDGVAKISDDTQMTLFTATGLLLGITQGITRGIMGPLAGYVGKSYLDWLKTQQGSYPEQDEFRFSWLSDIRELYSRRAPGNTCLAALAKEELGHPTTPINQSKGCKSIAFLLISSGIYGYPVEDAWRVAIRAIQESAYPMEVTIAVIDGKALALGNRILAESKATKKAI